MNSEDESRNLRVVYRIDSDDRITALNSGWKRFAEINGAPDLNDERLIGQSLWQYIADDSTVRIYEILLREIRQDCASLTFPFRCDSPEMRRYMEMNLVACGEGSVEFRSRIVRTELRNQKVFCQHASVAAKKLLLRCSFCNRVRFEENWSDVVDAAAKILDREIPMQVCYAVCETCDSEINSRCFRR